ncbi:MAG TPA: hypothetical protein VLL07_00025 [Pontiella sp.]|nr:hypothetical protein [Pontiella sp.]
MTKFGTALILWCLLAFPLSGYGQEDGIEPMLDVAESQPQTAMLDVTPTRPETKNAVRVTAVYGVGADDYLPLKEVARQHLRPNVRRNVSRPAFNLPDAFFFIGAPVFILIFLRVLVIFLNGFEEKRKEEMRMNPNNYLPGERVPGD